MSHSYVWTSEYVSPGHPDKVADQISDSILDLYLQHDPDARVACETMVKGNSVYIAGEITSKANFLAESDFELIKKTIRDTISSIGYVHPEFGFHSESCTIHMNISAQSPEINRSVDKNQSLGAGDQGIMFGFATNDTPTKMPLAIYLAKEIVQYAYRLIFTDFVGKDILRPDMKSQISLHYNNGHPTHIDSLVLSCCHSQSLSLRQLQELFHDKILNDIKAIIPENIYSMFTKDTKYYINPAGEWNIGGPISDCGLTGRKIVVDQYGADCEIGGGAFSGKDPSKVDKSAAYMARHIALKTLAEHEHANNIKVQLAYAIGQEFPVSYRIYDSLGKEYSLGSFSLHDLTPSAIIERLELQNPIYLATSHKGHFGNSSYNVQGINYFTWEDISE
jgi:S-adenosylmethionine synthetase